MPFHGPRAELDALVQRLAPIAFEGAASLTVVDNRRDAPPAREEGRVIVLPARERQSSYYARNRGAAVGSAPWIVFLDADVEAPGTLVDEFFQPEPGDGVAVLAGGVTDEPPVDELAELPAAAYYAHTRGHMSQDNTLRAGPWGYAQTANCAVRRVAFEEVGGFEESIRSGGDADLCFRLRQAGWEIESRAGATAVHRSRRTLRALLRQRARHGSGAAWLNRRYPGSFPRARYPGLAYWAMKRGLSALALAGRGDRRNAIEVGVETLSAWAFELGRLAPNRVAGDRRPERATPAAGE